MPRGKRITRLQRQAIRSRVKDDGLTIEAAAKDAGVSTSYVYKLCRKYGIKQRRGADTGVWLNSEHYLARITTAIEKIASVFAS